LELIRGLGSPDDLERSSDLSNCHEYLPVTGWGPPGAGTEVDDRHADLTGTPSNPSGCGRGAVRRTATCRWDKLSTEVNDTAGAGGLLRGRPRVGRYRIRYAVFGRGQVVRMRYHSKRVRVY